MTQFKSFKEETPPDEVWLILEKTIEWRDERPVKFDITVGQVISDHQFIGVDLRLTGGTYNNWCHAPQEVVIAIEQVIEAKRNLVIAIEQAKEKG